MDATRDPVPAVVQDEPIVIPGVELSGPLADRLKTLDLTLARLQTLRSTLGQDSIPGAPPTEVYGPYVNAPVWPWFAAGWVVGALFALLFLLAWSYA
jgi:hypothetical protein